MASASLAFIDGVGTPEMALIFILVLVLFGGQKLPEFARGLGKTIREFKKAAAGVEDEFKRALEEDERKTTALNAPAATTGAAATATETPADPNYHPDEYHDYNYHPDETYGGGDAAPPATTEGVTASTETPAANPEIPAAAPEKPAVAATDAAATATPGSPAATVAATAAPGAVPPAAAPAPATPDVPTPPAAVTPDKPANA